MLLEFDIMLQTLFAVSKEAVLCVQKTTLAQ